MLKKVFWIKKPINLFLLLNLIGIIILTLSLGFYISMLDKKVIRKNFGFGSKTYWHNKLKWNLSYIDDAKKVDLINFVNKKKALKKSDTMYQINVYGFSDGNGDGIGDLIGARNHLSYLDNLGIGSIWLSPIHTSPSYHGYDVMDYTSVSDEYGGMEAFNGFLKEAHNRGIKIYLDMVFNHTSAKHPWFANAIYNPQSKYKDYYIFGEGESAKNAGYDSDLLFYSAFNWHGMPDLNLTNPNVLNELDAILTFWVKKGVDGFRFDAFKHFYDKGTNQSGISGGKELFARLKKAVNKASIEIGRKENDVQFMGEGLGVSFQSVKDYLYYNNSNEHLPAMDGAYDPDYWSNRMPLLDKSTIGIINYRAKTLKESGNLYNPNRKMVPWIPFLENHDTNRWLASMRRNNSVDVNQPLSDDDKAFAKSAYATLILSPGRPIIYQGGELGYHAVKRSDPYMREPLTWKGEAEISFFDYDIYSAKYKLKTDDDPIKLTESKDVGTVGDNLRDSSSILNHIKNYLSIKAKYKWLNDPINPLFSLTSIDGISLIDGGIRKNITTHEEILWLGTNITKDFEKKGVMFNNYNLSSYINNRHVETLLASDNSNTNDLSSIRVSRHGVVILRITPN